MDARRRRGSAFAVTVAVSLSTVASLTGVPSAHPAAESGPETCGLTTLEGTIDLSAEAHETGAPLRCGPGEPLVVRERLQHAKKGRAARRTELLTIFTIADVQLADEEAPARVEWMDKCEDHPAKAAFRPHETMVPHLLNAHLRAANAIAQKGGPIMGSDFDYAIGLGDLADNGQLNEIRWIIDLFDGNKLVDPDSGKDDAIVSGADGYDGVQREDPTGAPAEPMTSPVEGERILDLSNEPFWAVGLRPGGRSLPWYTLPGNHDVKVQGNAPTDDEAWLQFINSYNQGHSKIQEGLSPDDQQRACEGRGNDPEFLQSVFTNPAYSRPVPADDRRRVLRREEWAQEHFTTTGVPKGHGYNRKRCRDENGELLGRACYSWTEGKFHFIGLDTNPDEPESSGNIDDPQFQWLERELISSSKKYFDAAGEKVANPKGTNRMIIVFAHHPVVDLTNPATPGGHDGQDLKQLLLRFPNVIINANGHTHQNRLWPRQNKERGTEYWEVNTSAVVDFPTQSRTLEIVNNHDGTLSFFSVVFNAMVAPNPRDIDWVAHDHTHETDHGAKRDINEDWLASFGQEVLFYDPQQDLTKIGRPRDRNVELLLKAPRWLAN
ncbi:MAG TPA: hypothetical protein VG408_09505 [Actinomycetota bacterium]|nr:hypothetical protein [Actinomycetota bacterium]